MLAKVSHYTYVICTKTIVDAHSIVMFYRPSVSPIDQKDNTWHFAEPIKLQPSKVALFVSRVVPQ